MNVKKVGFKLLCVTVPAMVLCLILAELLIRVVGLGPEVYAVQKERFRLSDNPLLGFELVPGYVTDEEGPMILFKGRANSLGFRDREHAIEKQEGVYRAVVLGDSIVQGFGIENDEDLLTSVLSRQLKDAGRNVEIFNFGVSGYNTQQEVETLREKGLQYRPDLVVVMYCLNDTSLCCGPILGNLLKEREKRLQDGSRLTAAPDGIHRLLLKSALFRWIYFSLQPEPEGMERYEQLKENTVTPSLDVLATLAGEHGFQVLIAVIPGFDNIGDYQHQAHHEAVRALCQSRRFHHLDLLPYFQELAKTRMVSMDAMHPNPDGHRLAGEVIAGYIESNIFGK